VVALDIRVDWQGGTIGAIHIASERPQPSRLLPGLDAATVLAVLARLYSVCGRAQRACAELALATAGGPPLTPARRAELCRAVAAEAVQEHLWRLLLDWPQALGLPQQQAEFKRWYGRIAADAALWPAELGTALERDWLGLPFERLADFGDLAGFAAWRAKSRAPFATLFARLGAEGASAAMAPGTTLAAESECALAACAEQPWIAALGAAGRWLEAHVAACLVGLAALLATLGSGGALVEMDAESPAPGRGVALVATARGMLEHDVTLAGGRVDCYAITTPTDCNFAPDGPFVRRFRGRPAASLAAARRAAALWVLAFDPCVAYAVSAEEPGHA
jgi:uptake hydrogenase large subunit